MKFTLPPDEGKKKRNAYFTAGIVLGIFGWALVMSGAYGDPDSSPLSACGGVLCCFSLIFAIIALSTPNDNNQVVVIQQRPQYVPVVQQPVQPRVVPPAIARPQPTVEKPNMFAKTKGMWIQDARNLELARNWEEAAKAYEKAGMYAEAGRIRKEHLEDKQPIVKIGKVGDTILHDSVMISDDNENDV